MVVVEVRQGPLQDKEEEEEKEAATNIKSNNPHLAGGEKLRNLQQKRCERRCERLLAVQMFGLEKDRKG